MPEFQSLLFLVLFMVLLEVSQISAGGGTVIKEMFTNDSVATPIYSILPWDISTDIKNMFTLHGNHSSLVDTTSSSNSPFSPVGASYNTTTTSTRNTNKIEFLSYLPIIQIYKSYEKFDPCDEDTFTSEAIKPFLDHVSNMTGNKVDFSTNGYAWIATFDTNAILSHCSYDDSIRMMYTYPTYLALLAQKLGAGAGFAFCMNPLPGLDARIVPPGVNIFMKEVLGVKITIPYLTATFSSIPSWFPLTLEKLFEDSSTKFFVMENPVQLNLSPTAPIYQPFGFYQVSFWIFGSISLYSSIFICFHLKQVYLYYKPRKSKASRTALIMRFMILIPECVSGIIKVAIAYDPLGIFLHFDHFIARFLWSLYSSISTFTDIVVIMYCSDVYHIYRASNNMEMGAKPFLMRYRTAGHAILIFGVIMIFIDQAVLYSSLTSRWGSDAIIIPVIYMMFMHIFTTVKLFQISCKMSHEVTVALKRLQRANKTTLEAKKNRVISNNTKIATSDALSTRKHQLFPQNPLNGHNSSSNSATIRTAKPHAVVVKLIQKERCHGDGDGVDVENTTKAFLRMRFYIMLGASGKCFFIFSLFLVGGYLFMLNSFAYQATFLVLSYTSTLISSAQIMGALQLPHYKKRKRTNTTKPLVGDNNTITKALHASKFHVSSTLPAISKITTKNNNMIVKS